MGLLFQMEQKQTLGVLDLKLKGTVSFAPFFAPVVSQVELNMCAMKFWKAHHGILAAIKSIEKIHDTFCLLSGFAVFAFFSAPLKNTISDKHF